MTPTLRAMAYGQQQKNAVDAADPLSYEAILAQTREHISTEHGDALSEVIGNSKSASVVKRLISQYLTDQSLSLPDMTLDELTSRLYGDMAGFGFLDAYLADPEVEGINGNRWDDIEIVTANGIYKITEHFSSPQHAVDVIRKMVRLGGLVLDGTTPIVDSFLSRGIRISAMIPPIADRDAGASFSIRRQRIKELSAQDFIDTKMASKDMLDFLSFALNHGASIAICGNTRGGKTSLISYLLSTVHPDRRIYCIEETKEIEVVRYGGDGRVANSVVHTTTRESESPQANVDMNDLLRHALRFDPDIIAPVEIRGPEALTVQEAGRTGHTIITSLHANSCRAAYNRILSMCEMADTMLPSHVLTQMIVEAFPIVVHLRRCPDNQRRMLEITEAVGIWDDEVTCNTLYRYDFSTRQYRQIEPVSDALEQRFIQNGATTFEMSRFKKRRKGGAK